MTMQHESNAEWKEHTTRHENEHEKNENEHAGKSKTMFSNRKSFHILYKNSDGESDTVHIEWIKTTNLHVEKRLGIIKQSKY